MGRGKIEIVLRSGGVLNRVVEYRYGRRKMLPRE